MKTQLIIIKILWLAILTSCQEPVQLKTNASTQKWDYIGESGPKYWAELESESECGGKHQSPINIVGLESIPGNSLDSISILDYEDATTIKSITNNGHSIQYNFDEELNAISYKGGKYKMKQFHYHAPSEHTINGVRYPLEIHLVHHCEETNSYIVFALLVEQGEPDPAFVFLENYLPIEIGETKAINEKYDLGSTVPEIFGMDSIEVYTYQGSLTTPPCTEEVFWIVMKNASHASGSQIETLKQLMPKDNYRDIQPIYDRIIHSETINELF